MGESSNIEWTDATWNPVVGCTMVSPGCAHCYAEVMGARLKAMAVADSAAGKDAGRKRHYVDAIGENSKWSGQLVPVPEALGDPLRWKRPRKVFVNSMSDLFHQDVPFEFIAKCFAVMVLAEQHTFQVLTKRDGTLRIWAEWLQFHWPSLFPHGNPPDELDANVVLDFLEDADIGRPVSADDFPPPWPPQNVLVGVSIEDQKRASRFDAVCELGEAGWRTMVSLEPLLGPVVIPERYLALGDRAWVIVGGESGHGARPMHPDWPRAIRDQCVAAGVPFFFKQWGEWQNGSCGQGDRETAVLNNGRFVFPDTMAGREQLDGDLQGEWSRFNPTSMSKVGKHVAGRMLDGREWSQFPTARKAVRT